MRGSQHGSTLDAAGLDQLGETVLRVVGLEALGLGRDDGLDVVAAALLFAAPLLDVVVVGTLAGPGRGLVDGDLEARVEHAACSAGGPPGPAPGPGCRATR